MLKRLKNIFPGFFVFILIATSAYAVNKAHLKSCQVSALGASTRIILSLDQMPSYKHFTLQNPDRLVVDIQNTRLRHFKKQLDSTQNVVKGFRSGIWAKKYLRLVFELNENCISKFSVVRSSNNSGYQLIIDLLPRQKISVSVSAQKTLQPATSVVQSKSIPASSVTVPQKENALMLKKNKPLRNIVVVIDPGHGGKDPGATGKLGTHEKNVVLAIGKDLSALLKQQPGITPYLTRDGDYFVTLRGRLKSARKGTADLFVAIHADAYPDPNARGASVFALSQRGATSEAARWLAQKENYSELMGGIGLEDKSYMLRSVLIDLSQTATIRDSLELGNYIIDNLRVVARLHRGFVEQARFVVLKSPDIPSLLVETGFLSNTQEERLLRTPMYQRRIARALAQGIISYLKKYPPPNSVFAVETKQVIAYQVREGESLKDISEKYNVSISKILAMNSLKQNKVYTGQIIKIVITGV